jgi:hypothetical protein
VLGHQSLLEEAAISVVPYGYGSGVLQMASCLCLYRRESYNCDVPGDLDRDSTSISLFSTERFLVRMRAGEGEGENEGRSEEAEGGDTA